MFKRYKIAILIVASILTLGGCTIDSTQKKDPDQSKTKTILDKNTTVDKDLNTTDQNTSTQEPSITTTLNDINITIDVKASTSFSLGLTPNEGNISIVENSAHANISTYLVGNEFWSMKYTSIDCFTGNDSFLYKQADNYGRVNVTINSSVSIDAPNLSKSLYNNKTIANEYLTNYRDSTIIITNPEHGDASLSNIAHEDLLFTYDPQNEYVGDDFFEYKVTKIVDECTYTKVGRVDLHVQSLIPKVMPLTKADFRTLLSSENPKNEDVFGSAVAIEDNTIVVGVPGKLIYESNRGEIIVYKKTPNGVEIIQHIQAPEHTYSSRHFGATISLKDGMLAVGNQSVIPVADANVYIYKQENNSSFTYVQTIKAIPNNDNANDNAFKNIAINKNYLLVGAENSTVDGKSKAGLVYVYKKVDDLYTGMTILQDENATYGGYFGKKLALMDDLVLIANPYKKAYENDGDDKKYGVLEIYKDKGSGLEHISSLAPSKRVIAQYNAYGPRFSLGIATNGSTLIVGAPYTYKNITRTDGTIKELSEVGSIFTYYRDGDDFVLVSEFSDPEPVAGEHFGKAVAIENPYIVVSNDNASNSDSTTKSIGIQIFQYSGEDTNYTNLGFFKPKPTYNTWIRFKERTQFGEDIDISNGTVIAGSKGAFNFSKLNTRAYKAGQAYLLECDLKRAYWVDYKKEVLLSDNKSYFNARITTPPNTTYTSSGVGVDSSLFAYDKGYISYTNGAKSGYDTCVEQKIQELGSCDNECKTTCTEMAGEYANGTSQFDFYSPSDEDSNNTYEIDLKINFNNLNIVYPFTIKVKESLKTVVEGHNDGMSYSHLDYNRLQLEGEGNKNYANKMLFENSKLYVSDKDIVYTYTKNSSIPEFIEFSNKVELLDVHGDMNITSTNISTFKKVDFDVENSRVAILSREYNASNAKNRFYVHLFNDGNYVETVLVHSDNLSNLNYAIDENKNSEFNSNVTQIKGVQLENGLIFTQYSKNYMYHDNNLTHTNPKSWEHTRVHNESGINIYTYDNTTHKYNFMQNIEVPANDYNKSDVISFNADGEFLLIRGGHTTDDYDHPYRFTKIYKFENGLYRFIQNFNFPENTRFKGDIHIENGYVLMESMKYNYVNLETDIYKYNSSDNNFTFIDSITNEEAGDTTLESALGSHIAQGTDGVTYLYKRFYKRGEIEDYYQGNGISSTIYDKAYIGVFKLDDTNNKFRFLGALTHRNSSNYFATVFAVDQDTVVANTMSTDSYRSDSIHSFKLTR